MAAMSDVDVSISITAYQHAAYLASCLDGILMQEGPYTYEVLLGEDGSTDGTRAIAERYAALHPDRIRLFLHDRSQLIRIDGRLTGRHNFLNNLKHARGRYLCHIDGDDRWTDPQRLRTMVERMDAEPDLMLAFHNADNVWPDGRREPYFDPSLAKERFTLEELTAKNFIPTSGVIWRWSPMTTFPRAWYEGPFGDWVLNVHYAMRGAIGYVDRTMSERRVNEGSIMAAMDPTRTLRGVVLAYEVMRGQLQRPLTGKGLTRWTASIREGFDLAQRAQDQEHMGWFLRHARAMDAPGIPGRERLRWWALVNFPGLVRAYHRWRTNRT